MMSTNRSSSVAYRCGLVACLTASAAACAPDSVVAPREKATGVVLSTSKASLASLGDSATVTSRVLDRDGKVVSGVKLSWSVTPANGVLQRDGEGVYRAVGNGHAVIVAEIDPNATGVRPSGYWAGHTADTIVVDVRQRAARILLTSVDTAFVTLGASRTMRAQMTDARGNSLRDVLPTLVWESANASIVTVDAAGLVRSTGEGDAAVRVRADDATATATFTVRPRVPHTSCMVYAQRRTSKQACVTLDFVMREREASR